MVARGLPAALVAVDARIDQAVGKIRAQQDMVETQAGVSRPPVSLVIPGQSVAEGRGGGEVFPKRSYHNNTNVRLKADMDLRVRHPSINTIYMDPSMVPAGPIARACHARQAPPPLQRQRRAPGVIATRSG